MLFFNQKRFHSLYSVYFRPRSPKIMPTVREIQEELMNKAESTESSSRVDLSPQFARKLSEVEAMMGMDRFKKEYIQYSVQYHKRYV